MIPQAYINEWRQIAPWQDDYQVEQDLIISRALTDMKALIKSEIDYDARIALEIVQSKIIERI